MKRLILPLVLMVVGGTIAAARGQAQPEAGEVRLIIEQLGDPVMQARALEKAKGLGETAIVPLSEALADKPLAQGVRQELGVVLEGIYAKARRARIEEDAKRAEAWRTSTGVEVYRKHAPDGKIDPLAVQALVEFDKDDANAPKTLKAAIAAGCTDPLVRYESMLLALGQSSLNAANITRQCAKLVADFETSAYPAGRKMDAYVLYLEAAGKAGGPALLTQAKKKEILDKAVAYFGEFRKEQPGWAGEKEALARIVEAARKNFGGVGDLPSKQAFEALHPELAKILAGTALLADVESEFYCGWASVYHDVPREQTDAHHIDYMTKAKEAAEPGWRLDALDPSCAVVMIKVCRELALDRATMESWFGRAFAADPHNYEACLAKLMYLLKRDASLQELSEFGRFCAQRGNWEDKLPKILIEMHWQRAAWTTDMDAYMKQPEVWPDLQIGYEGLVKDPRRALEDKNALQIDRAEYLKAACRCGQWKAALALLDEWGNQYTPSGWVFGRSYEENRAEIEKRAAGK